MERVRHIIAWCITTAIVFSTTSAWACPYCVGKDKDGLAASLVIVAMVSVPFFIVLVTGWVIRRANTDLPGVSTRQQARKPSEVC